MRSFIGPNFGLASVINFVEEVSRKITDNGVAVGKIYLFLTIHLLLVNHTMNPAMHLFLFQNAILS